MNILTTLVVLFLLAMAGVLLIPVLTVGVVLLAAGGVFLIWLLPILIIAASDKTTGGEKAAWILAVIFISWFAWIFYFFLAPIKPRERARYYYY